MIDSLVTGDPYEAPGQHPQRGQAPGLPPDVVVESICVVDGDGVRGRDVSVLPAPYDELVRRHVATQELTVEAALRGDRALAAEAFVLDPLAGRGDLRTMETMVDELLAGTAEWLPQFAVDPDRPGRRKTHAYRIHRPRGHGPAHGPPPGRGGPRGHGGVAQPGADRRGRVTGGASTGKGPRGVAEASEVVILCVPNSPEVVEVVDAMLPALGPGKMVVDCSTIDPEVERAQHARVGATGAALPRRPALGRHGRRAEGDTHPDGRRRRAVLADTEPALDPFAGLIVHVGGPGMGQVVKLCNNLIYAAQMMATAEATALAVKSGVDMGKLYEVLTHSTGDCVAVRTRLPVPGVVPDSPASNGWQPGFMTDLMAKDLDLALAYAARTGVPVPTTAAARQVLTAASSAGYGREDFSAVAKVVLALSGPAMTRHQPLPTPALILAADHRARGVITIENWADYFGALAKALPSATASWPPPSRFRDWPTAGHLASSHRTYLSLNRTGLAGSAFELDDRLVASVGRAAVDGWTGIKHMTRIDMTDPVTAAALELLGRVLEDARDAGLEALVEPLLWRDGRVCREPD